MKTSTILRLQPSDTSERLHDHPDFQRENRLLAHLEAAHRRQRLEITRHELRHHIVAGDIEGKRGDRNRNLAARLAEIETELAIQPAGVESKIQDALAVADGAELPSPLSPAQELERLRRRELFLWVACGEQREKVEVVKGRVSLEYAQRTRADHQKLLAKVYRAASAFAAALDAEQAFRADLINRNFVWRPDEHPQPPLRSAAILGRESDPSSELSRWRRTLEDAGVL